VRFWRNEHIERRAEERLAQLATSLGRPITPPIPVDHFIEHVLKLDLLWDVVEERPGEVILGAIKPRARQIVINETHVELFGQRPGLERFTKLHEGGHWDLLTDQAAIDHPQLLGVDDVDGPVSFRQSRGGLLHVLKALCVTTAGVDYVCDLRSRADDPYEKRVVNRYAGAVLIPRQLLRDDVGRKRPEEWPDVYRLADRYEVTPTAMKVRLNELGLVYIDEGGMFHRSKAEAAGQQPLFG
jgi:hypothetical protein